MTAIATEGGAAWALKRNCSTKLATNTWDKRSRMQQEMVKGAKGEPFAVQELYRKGPLTPSQLASSMKTTTGRVSTLLSALEKKGQITRESDPDDRRVVHVNLTEAGRERAERQREMHARGDLLDLLADGGAPRARIR